MDIRPNEVESVKVIGNLFGDDVKLIKTFGGFFIAVGKKKRSLSKTEPLAAGSHEAIVAHHISKEYGTDFKPAMLKSEQEQIGDVEDNSSYLDSESIQKGIELFTIKKNNNYEFLIYKQGITLAKYYGEIENQSLVIKNSSIKERPSQNLIKSISKVVTHKVEDLGLKGVKKGW